MRISSDPVPIPSEVAQVPLGFDAWFERATRRNPDDRFQSASELHEALVIALR